MKKVSLEITYAITKIMRSNKEWFWYIIIRRSCRIAFYSFTAAGSSIRSDLSALKSMFCSEIGREYLGEGSICATEIF